jgi:hypothetical protein
MIKKHITIEYYDGFDVQDLILEFLEKTEYTNLMNSEGECQCEGCKKCCGLGQCVFVNLKDGKK